MPTLCRAFSLVEVAVVIIIIGIIGAIAVPRLTGAAVRTRIGTLRANIAVLDRAAEMYAAEHAGRCPACDSSGSIDPDGDGLAARLLDVTAESGAPGGHLGPYLLRLPPNPFNGLATVRIDGAAAGAGTHGWRYDSALRSFRADDSPAMAAIGAQSVHAATAAAGGLIAGDALDAAALKALDGDDE
ncbi:MAG: prepilin-type N-terminal cleavage/methylation domain-containing protein [Phycisphaeraceae bacterium]|nr:prepilin-type N-terminal cleavage/methylation domain-containing protein [Phycisphaeraceae bacterium]